jgi:peptidoglycan hydrolase CwlO-like protein
MQHFREESYERHLSEINHTLKEIKHLMSTVPSGLAALQQAVSDLTSAVSGAATAISAIAGVLAANEDPAVQALAAQVEEQVSALKAATATIEPPSAA